MNVASLDDALVFARVVEAGSFTAAARGLGLPKSTVSRRISRLEKRLGARLLQRTTRRLKLTDVGAAYYERAVRIVNDLDEADLAVARLVATPRGTLRLTAPVDLAVGLLGPVLSQLLGRHEVQVEAFLTDRVVDLVEEGFDVAIRAGPLPDSTLVARRLGTVPRFLCASPEYLRRRGAPKEPEDLLQHDCILFQGGEEEATWKLERKGRSSAIRIVPRLTANNHALIGDAAASGLGIARMPAFRCTEHLRSGRLRRLLDDWRSPGVPLHAVYPSARHLSPRVRVFLDLLAEAMSPPPWDAEATG